MSYGDFDVSLLATKKTEKVGLFNVNNDADEDKKKPFVNSVFDQNVFNGSAGAYSA